YEARLFGGLAYNGRRRRRRCNRERRGFGRFRHTDEDAQRLRLAWRSNEIECAERSEDRDRCGESKSGSDTLLFSYRNCCDRGRAKATGKGSAPFRLLQAHVHFFRKRGRILRTFPGIRAKHSANEISYKSWDCSA